MFVRSVVYVEGFRMGLEMGFLFCVCCLLVGEFFSSLLAPRLGVGNVSSLQHVNFYAASNSYLAIAIAAPSSVIIKPIIQHTSPINTFKIKIPKKLKDFIILSTKDLRHHLQTHTHHSPTKTHTMDPITQADQNITHIPIQIKATNSSNTQHQENTSS